MSDTPNVPTPPASLTARIREILGGRSKWAITAGGGLLAIVIAAGAMSRHAAPTPHTPPVTARAATAAPRASRPVAAATHPATPPTPRPAARNVAVASAPPAQPQAASAASVLAPAKPAPAQTPAAAAALVSAAMPKPPKLIAGHALETTYDLSSAGGWVQTMSVPVPLPRSSFVVRASTQAARRGWAAWFKVPAPTTVLTLTLARGTDGSVTVSVDGMRAFDVARSAYSLAPRATFVSPLTLAPGWHELAVTYSRKWGWRSGAQITLAAGNGVDAPSLLSLNAAPVATAAPASSKPVEAKP